MHSIWNSIFNIAYILPKLYRILFILYLCNTGSIYLSIWTTSVLICEYNMQDRLRTWKIKTVLIHNKKSIRSIWNHKRTMFSQYFPLFHRKTNYTHFNSWNYLHSRAMNWWRYQKLKYRVIRELRALKLFFLIDNSIKYRKNLNRCKFFDCQ